MDDGLVLNIAANDSTFRIKESGRKGGRWTDRLKAKRVVKRKLRTDEKSVSNPNPLADGDDVEQRPAKRPRKEEPTKERARKESARTETTTAPSTQPRQNARAPQIISSLFSSNPKVEAVARPGPVKPAALPSNAPLDSSTFTGLGLNPLLISHLTSKMNIEKPTAIQRASLPALLAPAASEADIRDAFIQSQTGSGKTLSFLLPIIEDLLPLSSLSYIDRSIGTLAVIITPTRELAKQISDVLEILLKLRLRPEDEADGEGDNSKRLTRWLVSGLLIGGATRTHEKARLRKGVPILVSTPGRLLDHLQNTSSFNIGKCRWLVLDEADRLMELGFEDTINGIIKGLDGRRRLAIKAVEDGNSIEVGGWDWERRRRTILCSATIREDVKKLAGTALINPVMIKATEVDKEPLRSSTPTNENAPAIGLPAENFTPPSQLSQKYLVVPLKLRLVALVALLRTLIAQSQARRGTKIIIFLSCTDSVDFHWKLLGGSAMSGETEAAAEGDGSEGESGEDDSDEEVKSPKKPFKGEEVEAKCALLPDTSIYRLHGSLPTATRLAALKGFSRSPSEKNKGPPPSSSSILLCTSVASRGLDLPLVRAVIQYDLPTEGGANEYVHRVGRTARAGKGGEAWSMVLPSESEWVKWVETKMQGDTVNDGTQNITLTGVAAETVLRSGFGGNGIEYEERATEVQLAFERWVLRKKENVTSARKAYLSHIRAYATHPSNEKHIFHIRNLHLGHLAKAFALREAPKSVTAAGGKSKSQKAHKPKVEKHTTEKEEKKKDWDRDHSGEAEKRMQAVVRAQGRLTKKGGVMVSSGASEFQIASGYALEKLANGL
ncbi:P-loop containing nucleoside triphosphate hydrolase protein [Crucibulum laeve]|uniref:ATP-dependent RNA helicase n=1 Tax=Crucibulum laeve TaxID=68775 RepID=A0A5C3MKD6_9AGAR|nr:P-loop containing nucleoside triphosphate hydrolase protein [Crucibulum laeve]